MRLVPIDRFGTSPAPIGHAPAVVGHVIEATVALYERRGFVPPWTGYLAIEGNEIVGTCGFAGPPHAGEVEIAYFTLPGNEGRGVAKLMARSLLEMTRRSAEEQQVQFIAHTLPEHGPSTSILKALRFKLEAQIQHPEDGPVWKWRQSSSEA